MSQVPQIGCCILRSGIVWNSPRKRHETRETSKKKPRVSSAVLDGSVRPTWGWCSSRFIFQVAWFWWNPAAVMVALHGLQQSHVWPGYQPFPSNMTENEALFSTTSFTTQFVRNPELRFYWISSLMTQVLAGLEVARINAANEWTTSFVVKIYMSK